MEEEEEELLPLWQRWQPLEEQQEAVEAAVEEAVEEEWRTGRRGTLLSANWKLWRGKRGTEQGPPEPSITSTPSSDEGRRRRRRKRRCMCVCVFVRVKARLDEAAYIIAIHNQYFYFVSKEELKY